MKRVLKVIVPVLLTLTVLISVGWYFIQYDPDLTRDILVWQARSLDDQGNHSLATWFYKMAYQHSGNDETIALELAEQYRSIGNYTKAEFTLSNAIADGGGVELYIALCNVYVEQDKLLDAVTMLDSVADPHIKAQLDTLRPQSPQPSIAPGYYSEYISVSFNVAEGAMCITTDGSYPSTEKLTYSSLISLPGGQTQIHCLTIGQNGLVSPLSVMDYTITGVVEEVTIDDPALDRQIRTQLQVDSDHVLFTNELWNITSLTVPYDTKSLSDLAKLPFLSRLTVQGLTGGDLSVIAELPLLEELYVTDTPVTDDDLAAIAALPKLRVLTLSGCSLSGIRPLSGATGLTQLDLGKNAVSDLTALSQMTNLAIVNLSHNSIVDPAPLSSLNKLEYLDISFNSISDASSLGNCSSLGALNLSGNSLTNIEGLATLSKLQILCVSFNKLTEVDASALPEGLLDLDVSNNAITDISTLNTMNSLVSLNISYNQIKTLPAFRNDCALTTLKASRNLLASVNELSGLNQLQYVTVDFNENLSSVGALAECYKLVQLNIYGTKAKDVDELLEMGVSVKYTPI